MKKEIKKQEERKWREQKAKQGKEMRGREYMYQRNWQIDRKTVSEDGTEKEKTL